MSFDEVVRFWFEDIDHSHWFRSDSEFDRNLERRFGEALRRAKGDELDHWCETPQGSLALVVVLDQFSRNIFRGTPAAFDADGKALQLVLDGIDKGFDRSLSLEQRSIYYLPLRHSEDLAMQELGLAKTREINYAGYGTDKYALSHLAIIERFGRFPHRNNVLGRTNTEEEESYLSDGSAGF